VASRLVIAFLCAGLTASCGRDAAPPAAAPKPASVTAPVKEGQLTTVTLSEDAKKRLQLKTAPVEQREVSRTRTLGGEVVAPSGTTISITAPVAGTLVAAETPPSPGATVTRGQALFRLVPILPAEREAAVGAQQALDAAVARRDLLALRVQRAERLFKDGSGSRRALEEAQAELALAEADLKASRERVALAGRSGTSTGGLTIEAPESASVQNVLVSAGQTVAAGQPLVELVQLATVWVRVPVYAGELASIDSAAAAVVSPLGQPDDAAGLTARPIKAPPSANPTTAGVDLYYALANPAGRFRPSERVAVRLRRRDSQTGLVAPKAALLHDAYGGTWVYVARGDVFVRTRVAVADIVDDLAVLSQGPPAGTQVVTDGAAEIFGVEFGAGK
jgi:RND family efflux transporter MFP subunit